MITPITILLIAYILFQELHCRSVAKKICSYFIAILLFELVINVGYAFKLGGSEISYADLLWVVLLMHGIAFCFSKRLKTSNFIAILVFFLTLLFTLLSEMLNPYMPDGFNARSIMVFAKIMFAVFLYNTVFDHYKSEILEETSKKLIPIQKFIYVMVIIELVLENVFNSNIMTEIVISIFGNAVNQVTWLERRGMLYSVQGLCKEPSHFAILLLFISLFDFYLLKSEKDKMRYYVINCLLLLVSGSFSSIMFLGGLIVVFLVDTKRKKTAIATAILMVLAMPFIPILVKQVAVLDYYYQRVLNLLGVLGNGDYHYSSEFVRMQSIASSFEMWTERPFFGVGLGNNVLTGGGVALLSALGIVNTVVLLSIFLKKRAPSIAVLMVIFASCVTMDIGAYYSIYMALFFMIMQNKNIKTVSVRAKVPAGSVSAYGNMSVRRL